MKRYSMKQYGLTLISVIIIGIFLFPIYWMVSTSVKPIGDVFSNPPMIIPESIQFDAYIKNVIEDSSIFMYLKNSLIIALGTSIITLVLALPAAYGIARLKLKGNGVFLLILLVTQMLPGILMAMPLFILFSKINLLNSYLALIIGNTTLTLPFAILIMRPFFQTLPSGIEEAAAIDGCNRLMTFIRVVLPLTRPTLLTVGAFSFLFAWGDLIFALTLSTDDAIRPLTLGLTKFIGQYGVEWTSLMAVATTAAAPVILVFILLQKYIVSGITAGSGR